MNPYEVPIICVGSLEPTSESQLTPQIKRFVINNNFIKYISPGFCATQFMATNIDISEASKEYRDYVVKKEIAPLYQSDVKDVNKVNISYTIEVKVDNQSGEIKKDNPVINEVDNLIKGFQF